MKKVMSLVMVLVCFVAMAGCGEMKESDFEPGKLVKEDFALINTETGVKLTLGMTKKEIEKLIGKPTEEHSSHTVYDGGLDIIYRNGIMASMGVYLTKVKPTYKTPRGIDQNSAMNDVRKKYGNYIIDSDYTETEVVPGHLYIMNLKSGEIISQTVNREFANSSLPLESIATICFNAAKDGDTIYSFTISDGEMYFNRE